MAPSTNNPIATTMPELAFSPIHITINDPPQPSPLATSSPGIAAPTNTETDPLASAIQLPKNYLSLDEATQTSTLLFASHAYLTDPTIASAFASTHITQQRITAAAIAAHGPALRYLDALNRVKAKREEFASYLDNRAPAGRCARGWVLREAEGLVGELEGVVRKARGLRDARGVGGAVGVGGSEVKGGEGGAGRVREGGGKEGEAVQKKHKNKKSNAWAKAFAEL